MNRWTDDEILTLKQLYPKTYAEDIAKQLKRTPCSIYQKAFSLGLKVNWPNHRPRNWNSTYINSELSREDLAYIAGIFDGEGWIEATRGWYNKIKKEKYNIQFRLYIGNTNIELIKYIQSKLEGSFRLRRRKKKETYKDFWIWWLGGNIKVGAVLTKLLPYLIVKRDAAKQILERPLNQWGL